ncbi:SURF1 family protein [Marinobacter sp. SS8-8]|uniref:SURF1 family protein n=1 Tax=Marinobacter sp. SS8-8 TaxID=3050452 RepID=UPI0026DF37FD|nr:SURF1 family protein [Marinobacter sp. SS8-8]|tara:strand:- start:31879 stop:32613 length:735 start_codon:yes stop_codon:yes gene_type:complete
MSDSQRQRRHWQLDWRLLVFSGVFLPVLISLGIWQLNRAAEKQLLLDQWQQEAVSLDWSDLVALDLSNGRPVTLTGLYRSRSWLLDNRTRDGVPGYEVLTVFRPVSGPPVVVNRGWVPAPRTRGQLPEVDPPEGVFTLQGRISDYPVPPVLGDQPTATGSWPRRVQSLSKEVARAEIPELPGRIVRLSGDHQPGAYRADWQPDLMGPQTHYGYATQWFALAVALTILTVVASYRKSELPKDRSQ